MDMNNSASVNAFIRPFCFFAFSVRSFWLSSRQRARMKGIGRKMMPVACMGVHKLGRKCVDLGLWTGCWEVWLPALRIFTSLACKGTFFLIEFEI